MVAIAIAAVLGVWAFAATRASSADLDEVEYESKAADMEFRTEIKELNDDIHEFDVKQSAFRAQVREKLQIPNN
jgi:cell division protein FtsL